MVVAKRKVSKDPAAPQESGPRDVDGFDTENPVAFSPPATLDRRTFATSNYLAAYNRAPKGATQTEEALFAIVRGLIAGYCISAGISDRQATRLTAVLRAEARAAQKARLADDSWPTRRSEGRDNVAMKALQVTTPPLVRGGSASWLA